MNESFSLNSVAIDAQRSSQRSQLRRDVQRHQTKQRRMGLLVIVVMVLTLGGLIAISRGTPSPTVEPTVPIAPVHETVKAVPVVAASPVTQSTIRPAAARWSQVPYGDIIARAARRHGIDPALLMGLIKRESAGFQARISSPVGARGLAQLMPATARSLGLRVDTVAGTDSYLHGGVDERTDPVKASDAGARYLQTQLQKFKSVPLALAAYNAGPNAVTKYGGIPPYNETQQYVEIVQQYAAEFRAISTS